MQLGLEEDACREVSDTGHRRAYLTDRLGMPLIETVTAPDLRTPQEVADVAQLLRKLVRSTGKVRTGTGAARQDVNVSVSGGTRIEIKGVSRIRTGVPQPVWEREEWFCRLRLPEDCVAPLSISPYAGLFAHAVRDWALPPFPAVRSSPTCLSASPSG